MAIELTMIDAKGNIVKQGDTVLVGAGDEFERFTFRCFDTNSNLAFIKPLKKNETTQQALPQLVYKEGFIDG